jgi:hypothetical protein
MTKPATDSVLAAGAIALAVIITRIGPAQRAAVASAAQSPAPASELSARNVGEALAHAPRSDRAGLEAVPRDDDSDDGSDSGDGGESDDGGDDEDAEAA